MSTCSTSEVEAEKVASSGEQNQEKEETTAAEAKAGEKEKEKSLNKKPTLTLAEGGFITVHLKMPGVPHPVDVMVSGFNMRTHIYYVNL